MKLLICGSRCIDNFEHVYDCINQIVMQEYSGLITEIIEGGAKGVDNIAAIYAKEHYISLRDMPADWKKYGKKAGFIRNKEMVDLCDYGIAIWDGYSKGTKHTIDLLKKQNKLIRVFE